MSPKPRRPVAVAALLLPLLAAGCASAPSSFFTLSPATAPTGTPSELSIAVGPVSIPGTVDRPQMVATVGPNQVQIDEQNRWASPLRGEISRTVAQNLSLMLGTPHVTQAAETASAGAQYRVSVEVQRLEAAPGAWAAFEAVWNVRRTADGKSLPGRTEAREALTQPGYAPVAAAQSRAVARMSQSIAEAIRALAATPVRADAR